ncbi:MAG TPA: RNA polymerase subunit sigma-24, partial [Roseimicrobium sp.]|nr:RNA polymerase subunit sigma-24 [Roseimicrobium sp.]
MEAPVQPDPASTRHAAFHNTRWSVVLAAQGKSTGDASVALELLCRQYWPPLYAYVRHRGYKPHDAQDLTQAFFARLLEKEWLSVV